MDTDSVIFVDDGSCPVITGKHLGDLTDELDGDHIVEFVSTGPKCYAYTTAKGKNICKCKGFSLNFAAAEKINFTSLKDMVMDKNKKITINPLKFNITENHQISTEQGCEKTFKFTYDKREILQMEDFQINTRPFY